MGPPEQDSNIKKKLSALEFDGGVYKKNASPKAIETSSLPSSGVVTPSTTSTTNLSLLS
jgi:hypothetical protein